MVKFSFLGMFISMNIPFFFSHQHFIPFPSTSNIHPPISSLSIASSLSFIHFSNNHSHTTYHPYQSHITFLVAHLPHHPSFTSPATIPAYNPYQSHITFLATHLSHQFFFICLTPTPSAPLLPQPSSPIPWLLGLKMSYLNPMHLLLL